MNQHRGDFLESVDEEVAGRHLAFRVLSEERSPYSEIAGTRAGHASSCEFLVHLDALQVAVQFLDFCLGCAAPSRDRANSSSLTPISVIGANP